MVERRVCVRRYVQPTFPIDQPHQHYAIATTPSLVVRLHVVVSSFWPLGFLARYPYLNHHYPSHLTNLNSMMTTMNWNCWNCPMQSRWPLSNLRFRRFQPCPALCPMDFKKFSFITWSTGFCLFKFLNSVKPSPFESQSRKLLWEIFLVWFEMFSYFKYEAYAFCIYWKREVNDRL